MPKMEDLKIVLCMLVLSIAFAAHATTTTHPSTSGDVTGPIGSPPTPPSGTNPPPSSTNKLTPNATRPLSKNVTNTGMTTTPPRPSTSTHATTTTTHPTTSGDVTGPNGSPPTPPSGTNPPPSSTSKLTPNVTRPLSKNVTNTGSDVTRPLSESSTYPTSYNPFPFTFDHPDTPSNNTTFPNGSALGAAFSRIVSKQSDIRNSLYNFHNYEYSSHNAYQINDGGNDMYDGGNMISFSTNGTQRRVEYNVYYSEAGNYEFASVTGWPFVALMYINNTNYFSYSYTIRVSGDAGADGSGYFSYFSNSVVDPNRNISLAYYVTQIYNAGDSTICEVYFALAEGNSSLANFYPLRNSRNTNDIDSSARLDGYPENAWLGYMLLSRRYGDFIYPHEVENALTVLVGAIFDYNAILNFPPSSIQTTPIPHFTTPYYPQYAYEGVQTSICGNYRSSSLNTTVCEGNTTPSVLTVSVSVPTPLGFDVPIQAAISGCVDSDTCWDRCSNISNIIGNVSILNCQASCCSYSYCNYHYYYHGYYDNATTPPDITIPESDLPELPVEILPNCFFKQMFPRLTACVSDVFNAWPFSSTDQCKSSLSIGMQCGVDIVRSCSSSDWFSTALTHIPPGFDFNLITDSIQQLGVLEILCEIPASHLPFANFTTTGPYNSTYSFPVFPSPIGVGAPFCDNFILDSVISWSLEYLTVLKTSTDRNHMCGSLKGFVNKIMDAVENRCDFDHLVAAFPCDSLTRNQLRALVVQAKELLPQVVPSYCDGIEPPTEPERPDDIPLLPSCTLRQTIKSVWTCEKIFTSSAPYSDSDVCKTNINRLLQCVANQLQACGTGDGYNLFDNLFPGLTFQNIIDTIRSLARPPSPPPRRGSYYYDSYHYNGRDDFLENFCSGSSINTYSLNSIFGAVLGVCTGNFTGKSSDHITQAYYAYAGARNAADVCMAFRTLRDWFYNAARDDCEFSLFQYYLPIQSPIRNFVSHGIDILIDVLPELEISVCPKVPTNQTFVSGNWLQSYIKWRSHSLPRWQSSFAKLSSDTGVDAMEQVPSCLDLTNIMCRNPGMKTCESDYYKCPICYCSDNKYKNLAGIVMAPWLQDYENWEKFMAMWEDKFDEWEQESEY